VTRRLKHRAGESPPTEAQVALDAFVGPPRSRKSAAPRRKQHIEEMTERMKRKSWEGITPGKLVALYWLCHQRVYGVVPAELDKAPTWRSAMQGAGSMVKRHFDGDVQRAIIFMRWVWTQEQSREEWRRANNKSGGRRISWQNQFHHDYLISDWRAAAMRARGTG